MEYGIRFISGEPKFDSLSVIKLCCETSIDINSRIYGQAQVGRSEDLLYAKILSFESEPDQNSTVWAKFEYNGKIIEFSVRFDNSAKLLVNKVDRTDALTCYITSGEDLQGEYWGAVIMLPLSVLFEGLEINESSLPITLKGNIARENPEISSAVALNDAANFILMQK